MRDLHANPNKDLTSLQAADIIKNAHASDNMKTSQSTLPSLEVAAPPEFPASSFDQPASESPPSTVSTVESVTPASDEAATMTTFVTVVYTQTFYGG